MTLSDRIVSALICPAVERVLTGLIYTAVIGCYLFSLGGLLHVMIGA